VLSLKSALIMFVIFLFTFPVDHGSRSIRRWSGLSSSPHQQSIDRNIYINDWYLFEGQCLMMEMMKDDDDDDDSKMFSILT
jgi:hypothetical protein